MAVKGIDGAVELIVGVTLLVAPEAIDTMLDGIVGTAQAGDGRISAAIATLIAHADTQLANGGSVFLTAFLIAHGVIKLALVYALLRRLIKAYPWAIGVLVAFLIYQLFALINAPSVSQAAFCALDVAIVVLVWREYRELRGSTSR